MEQKKIVPNNTAVRVALWRALHAQIDLPPHIVKDEIGFDLIAPADDWRQRPDMDLEFTKRARCSIAARARFIEDLVIEQSKQGFLQYVILGAGLDTFAQRNPETASQLQLFEIDQPDMQTWKQQRLTELGYGLPEWLHFVPVDFEISSWWEQLINAGFDITQPAAVACAGVSMYLTKQAVMDTLRQLATMAAGSKLVMTFLVPVELVDEADKVLLQISEKGARASGNPFISFFTHDDILTMAREAGFKNFETVSSYDLAKRYFADRKDGLAPASGEDFLVATT
jgi:methyltransferase (TIGR00027 family)